MLVRWMTVDMAGAELQAVGRSASPIKPVNSSHEKVRRLRLHQPQSGMSTKATAGQASSCPVDAVINQTSPISFYKRLQLKTQFETLIKILRVH